MRILIAHNRYRSDQPSGENAAVEAEIGQLTAAGVEVRAFLPDSDGIAGLPAAGKLGVAAGPVLNPSGIRELTRLIGEFRPDVLHLHNVFPLISPWAVRAARAGGVPVVQTVHNYRHSCVAGLRYRAGAPCDACVGRRIVLPAVRHGCYRGSRLQSTAMALGHLVHRGTWRSVDRFLAVSPLLRRELLGLGVPADRIVLRPTSVPDPGPPTPLGRHVLFAGRLDDMKGAALLLSAWCQADPPPGARLRIAGDGPAADRLHRLAEPAQRVDLLGLLPPAEVEAELRAAALVAIPSLWYEGGPRIYVQALAAGRPVLATDVGSLADVGELGIGWAVPPRAGALAAGLAVLHDRDALRRRGERARSRYLAEHGQARSLDLLLAVYQAVAGTAPSG